VQQMPTTPHPSRRSPALTLHAAALVALCACGTAGAGPGGAEPAASIIQVTIQPRSASLTPGGTLALLGLVTGTIDTSMTWSVVEGLSGGNVTPVGLYTAPQAVGTYHVDVASRVDPTKSDRATVVVAAAPPPPPPGNLGGAGWTGSTSLVDYPKTGPVTSGGPIVDIDDGAGGKSPAQRLNDALALLSSNARVIIRNNSGTPVVLSGRISRSTAWGTKKEFFAYGTQRITLDAGNVASSPLGFSGASNEHWKGFEIVNQDTPTGGWNGIISINASSNLKIEDFWIHHNASGGSAIWLNAGDHVVVQDSIAWHNGDGATPGTNAPDGFVASGNFNAGGTMSSYVSFVRNVIINAGDDAIDLWYSHHSSVIDCALIGSGVYWNGVSAGDGNGVKSGGFAGGSPFAAGSANAVIGTIVVGMKAVGVNWKSGALPQTSQHNTSYGNGGDGYVYESLRHVFHDNISARNQGAIWSGNVNPFNGKNQDLIASSVDAQNNSYQITGGATLPQPFVDAANGDFSLPPGSPYLGAGTGGSNLGASAIALQLLKDNWTRR